MQFRYHLRLPPDFPRTPETTLSFQLNAHDEAAARQTAADCCGAEGPEVWLTTALCAPALTPARRDA